MKIACFSGGWRFPGELNSQRASANLTAMPDQKTGRREECNHEISFHSRLVSHSARALSVDDIPVASICTLAGAIVGFFTLCRNGGEGSDSLKQLLQQNKTTTPKR